ncbi:MAG: ATP-binding protein [Chloroflexota bacterium]
MEVYEVSSAQAAHLLSREEGHFVENKAIGVAPKKLTKSLSAFANADGGELVIGFKENRPGVFEWQGFTKPEDANGHIQHLEEAFPYSGDFLYEFLSSKGHTGVVLRITVMKTRDLRQASDGKYYVRRGSQSLPVIGEERLRLLQRAKGLITQEDETIGATAADLTNSYAILEFLLEVIPEAEPEEWLRKQRLIVEDRPTVAGVLLFSDEPQVYLPKAAVKIYRYGSVEEEGTRDTLAFDPIAVEGNLYQQVAEAVSKTVALTEQVQKMTDRGLVGITYPHEALHEVITNALLHRDYAHSDDVHIRIFDNRIEVESPGRLPAHVTPKNILRERFARNPTIVRLINKFPNPPNKDVGEGLNTAFAAMNRLRLRAPEIIELDNSVLVRIRHESLASPEQQIVEYLRANPTIRNAEARDITGVPGDQTMRKILRKLEAAGEIERVGGTSRGTTKYRLGEKVVTE